MIITIRHGERADAVEQLEEKFVHDPPLSKLGTQQSKVSGQKIQTLLDAYKKENSLEQLKLIVISSPYLRTVQTAYWLLTEIKEEIYENSIFLQKQLGEIFFETKMNFNPLQKLFTLKKDDDETYLEIKNQCDSAKLQLGGPFIAPKVLQEPCYPETMDSCFSRLQKFYEQLIATYSKIKSPQYVIICVTHQYCLECAQSALSGEELQFGVCGYCGILELAFQDIKNSDQYKILSKGENDFVKQLNLENALK